MFEELQPGIITLTIFLAVVGLYLSIGSWISWKRINEDTLRAKAFLTKDFLNKNFIITLIAGSLIATHTLLEFAQFSGYPFVLLLIGRYMELFYLLTLTTSMLLMVISAYYWYNLLHFQKF